MALKARFKGSKENIIIQCRLHTSICCKENVGIWNQENPPQFEFSSLFTSMFPPHSSHGMLPLSTCRLIPLLATGQQVKRYPPPCRRRGVHLDETPLGGSRFGRLHTQGNDILGGPESPHLAASIFPRLLTHADRGPVNSARPSRCVGARIGRAAIPTHSAHTNVER